MLKGTVHWFNSEKGYGFIRTSNKDDVFVHYADIIRENNEFQTLEEGESVSFEIENKHRGPVARNVLRLRVSEKDENQIIKDENEVLKLILERKRIVENELKLSTDTIFEDVMNSIYKKELEAISSQIQDLNKKYVDNIMKYIYITIEKYKYQFINFFNLIDSLFNEYLIVVRNSNDEIYAINCNPDYDCSCVTLRVVKLNEMNQVIASFEVFKVNFEDVSEDNETFIINVLKDLFLRAYVSL